MHTAKKNEQEPKMSPPTHIPLLPLKRDSATANGKVSIAGVKLPKNALNRYVSISKNVNINAVITP